jgi:hypothetical protein
MKEFEVLEEFKPKVELGKWFEVKDINHLATDTPTCI